MAVGASWPGCTELDVLVAAPADTGPTRPAPAVVRTLAFSELVGEPRAGDRVLINTGALDLELGTGGYAIVIAVPDRLPPDHDGPGHLIKARYTPLQCSVLGVDEQDSPHHDVLADADDLAAVPVVVADLHSAVPAIAAGVLADRPGCRIVYVATDGGALPLAFSRSIAGLREAGWLRGSVTVGQAFGGDLEAVTIHNGLLAARHVLGAEVVIVAQGPGNLGTGTRWGFSGVAAGEAVNAIATLNGRAVAGLRVSEADERERHYGVSHHSLTAYGRVALADADVPVPQLAGDFGALVASQAERLGGRHRLVSVPLAGLAAALERSPVPLQTMGRSLQQDQAAFLASAAAGRHAASLV